MATQPITEQTYYYGTGKRKTAIARVRLYPADRQQQRDEVNGKPLEEVFPWPLWQQNLREPLRVTETLGRFVVRAKVEGGGVSAQSDAVRGGIAWALIAYDEGLKSALRKQGFLTRDVRIKERKKYGLKRARRAPQYTKR